MPNAKVIDRADLAAAKLALIETITKKRGADPEPDQPRDAMIDMLTTILEKLDALEKRLEAAEEEGAPLETDDLTPEEQELVEAGSDIRHNRIGRLIGKLDSLLGGNGSDGE